MIDGVTNADAIPVLSRMMQFAGGRHKLIVNNIANFDTPNFRPMDVSVDDFRAHLGEAIDERRDRFGNRGGDLALDDTQDFEVHDDRLELKPRPKGDNLLFHDHNDRDRERIMQDLAENFMAFRTAAELMRSRFEILNTAIRERM